MRINEKRRLFFFPVDLTRCVDTWICECVRKVSCVRVRTVGHSGVLVKLHLPHSHGASRNEKRVKREKSDATARSIDRERKRMCDGRECDAGRRLRTLALDRAPSDAINGRGGGTVIARRNYTFDRRASTISKMTWPGEGGRRTVCEKKRKLVSCAQVGRTTARSHEFPLWEKRHAAHSRLMRDQINEHRLPPARPLSGWSNANTTRPGETRGERLKRLPRDTPISS